MYHKMRRFLSDIHVVEFDPNKYPSQLVFGKVGEYEELSNIHHPWFAKEGYNELAKINFQFFGGGEEYFGLAMHDSGMVRGAPHEKNVECYLDANNQFHVKKMDRSEVLRLKEDGFRWGGSLSYSLVINGKKEFIDKEHYPHFQQREPRTLVGQKKDGTMVLVVADGRSSHDRGLTGEQSADVMLELGCVNAINCDGGGSSEMMVRTKKGMEIVNSPSDGSERKIGTALLVFTKEDKTLLDQVEEAYKTVFDFPSFEELTTVIDSYNFTELHIHHTYKPDHSSFTGNNHSELQMSMYRFHTGTRGWDDIAQHVTLFPDGNFVTGRSFSSRPASIYGHNGSVDFFPFMVEMVGNFDEGHDKLEGKQLESIVKLINHFQSKGKYIRFHRENASKSCPGTGIDKDWLLNVNLEPKQELTQLDRIEGKLDALLKHNSITYRS